MSCFTARVSSLVHICSCRPPRLGLEVGRCLSARVGDLFKSRPKPEVSPPAKVDVLPLVLKTSPLDSLQLESSRLYVLVAAHSPSRRRISGVFRPNFPQELRWP